MTEHKKYHVSSGGDLFIKENFLDQHVKRL